MEITKARIRPFTLLYFYMVPEGELKHALLCVIVRLYSLSKTQVKPRKTTPTELAGEYHSLRNHSECNKV